MTELMPAPETEATLIPPHLKDKYPLKDGGRKGAQEGTSCPGKDE